MKKLLKRLAKKSMALVMAVLMLMSCWVFFAPVPEAHAAAQTLSYTLTQLYTTYLTDSAIASADASYVTPSFAGTAVSDSSRYARLLASPNYTNDAWTGTMGKTTDLLYDDSCDDGKDLYINWQWHVPTGTVVLVDGSTKPKIPVVLSADPQGNGKIVINGSWPSNSNFALEGLRWYGVRTDKGDFDYNAMHADSGNGLAGSKTDNTNLKYTRNNEAVQTAGVITFEGSCGNSFYKDFDLGFIGYTSSPSDSDWTSSTISVRAVNYAILKETLTAAAAQIKVAYEDSTTYANGKGLYTEASKAALVTVANQLLAAKPDSTYFSGSTMNYDGYAEDAQAAITAYNNWVNGGGLVRQYKITWANHDGTTLKTDYVALNATPSYTGTTPTKAADNYYTYTHNSWTPTIVAATKDQTYTATFTNTDRYYTVTFNYYNADGTAATSTGSHKYGATISAPNVPNRTGYKFKEWSPAVVTTVAGDATYTAVYDQTFVVTFKNYDGEVLGTQTVVKGGAATAPSSEPYKAPDADYEYTFAGWDTAFTNVQSNLTVTATFSEKNHEAVSEMLTIPATCTDPGMIQRWCDDCGYSWNDGTDFADPVNYPALGHTFERTPASSVLQTNGPKTETTHTIKCRECTATTTQEHTFNQVDTTKEELIATCIVVGEKYWKCACGYKYTEVGTTDPDNHVNTVSRGYKAPACGVAGFTGEVFCNDCQTIVTAGEVIPALEHSYTDYKSDGNATCTADGTKTALCDNGCGEKDTIDDVGSMISHKYTDYVYNEGTATCEENGTETALCAYGCGVGTDTREAAGTALDHQWGDWVSDGNGGHTRTCERAGCIYGDGGSAKTESGTCSKDNAAFVVTDPTCTEQGYTTYTCNDCGYSWVDDYTDALNHDWSKWSPADPTAPSASNHKRICKRCFIEETTNCTYTSVYTAPTCEVDAFTTYTCSVCNHGYSIVDPNTATGHKFNGAYKFDANTDKHQQACTNSGCAEYGVGTTKNEWADCSWTYANSADGKHIATCVCGNSEEQNCSGGQATCTAKAECQYCNTEYGTTSPHSYTGTVIELDGDVHAYLCVFCDDPTHYGVGDEKDATEACSGGSATCTEQANCEKCNDKYGALAPHSYTGTVIKLDGDVHAYRCVACDDQNLYGVGADKDATEPCSGGSATCTDKAVCDKCNDTHGEINPTAHKWSDWANVDGTLTHKRVCAYDGSHEETLDCFSSSPAVAAPDCNKAGFTLNTCDDCGHTWKTEHVDALGHDWSDWVSNDDLTHTRTCNRGCGYADNIQTEACTKAEATFVVTDPTCTEEGYTTYTCNDCGYVWVDDYTDELGHNYTEKVIDDAHFISAANCEQAALYWYDCSRCDKNAKVEEDTVKYTGLTFFHGEIRAHAFVNNNDAKYLAENATCFSDAKYYTSCKYEDCLKSSEEVYGTGKGVKFSDPDSRLEHDWKEVEDKEYLATKADCVNDATYYYECSLCKSSSKDYGNGSTWTKKDSKLDHAMTYTAGNKATCEAAGNYEYWYCSNCKKYYKDVDGKDAFLGLSETVIKKLGHDYEYRAYKAPTCEEDGYSAYSKCKNCPMVEPGYTDKVYPATGHKFAGNYVYDAVNHYHSKLCSNGCGKSGIGTTEYKAETVDGVLTVTGGEKCAFTYKAETVDGVHKHNNTCVCGNGTVTTFTKEQTYVKTVAPTCTVDGYDEYACPDDECGATWVGNIVKAPGHTLDGEAKSNGNGTHSISCSVCGYKNDTEKCYGGQATCKDYAICEVCKTAYGEKGTHVYDDTKWEPKDPAKCGVNATEKNACTACGEEITREVAGSALKHEMTGFVVTTPGTCTERAILTNSCTREGCDYTETKRGEKDSANHIKDGVSGVDKTVFDTVGNCATGVTRIYTCSYCGGKEFESVASAHIYKEYAKVYGTCTADGHIVIKCEQCSNKLTIDSTYPGFGGTITIEGYDGTIDTSVLKATGHKLGAVVVTKEPTCYKVGRGYRVCEGCKITVDADPADTKEIQLKAHDLRVVKGYEATCTSPGRRDYKECYVCGYSENADNSYAIPAPGHKDADANGKCDVCGKDLGSPSSKCGCMCHKESGFSKFIYKILRFFWKLFRMNKSCSCGNVHY